MITDHDALFKPIDAETSQKSDQRIDKVPGDTQPEHPHLQDKHIHGTENSRQKETLPQNKKNRHPPVPPEPHDPGQIEKWFEELILLHGGDLPEDLKALKVMINELESIRKQGEENLSKPTHPGQ